MKWRGKWLELGGAGIFRPEVTEPLGITSPVLAWGMGLERLAMLVLDLDDIRQLYISGLGVVNKQPFYDAVCCGSCRGEVLNPPWITYRHGTHNHFTAHVQCRNHSWKDHHPIAWVWLRATVRAKHLGKDIFAGLKNIVGGELKAYTSCFNESRNEALAAHDDGRPHHGCQRHCQRAFRYFQCGCWSI